MKGLYCYKDLGGKGITDGQIEFTVVLASNKAGN